MKEGFRELFKVEEVVQIVFDLTIIFWGDVIVNYLLKFILVNGIVKFLYDLFFIIVAIKGVHDIWWRSEEISIPHKIKILLLIVLMLKVFKDYYELIFLCRVRILIASSQLLPKHFVEFH